MKNNTPVKKDEEKDWREEFDAFVKDMLNDKRYPADFGGSGLWWGCQECGGERAETDIKSFISRLLRKEHTLLNEKMAKKIQDAFNKGYETAIDERKGREER